ncbi:hypothetical protein LTR53_014995 [Teratosphaeriaceae sp. CCFEE 6253]|nr:hypothetical protein LTR53_014995 [Teratosphaeriaceae sp. CCFEE 6253]
MARATQAATADTLVLLEERIRRVDYVLHGTTGEAGDVLLPQTSGSATARLRSLERALAQLRAGSPVVAEVLALQRAHPLLLHPAASDAGSSLPLHQLAALVLAHAPLYTSLTANLSQLQDTHVPDPAAAVKLVHLAPRVEKARVRQEQQARQLAELRVRSARVVEQWLEVGMLGMSGRWADWEERLRETEIVVRRREAARKREEGLV